MGKSRDFLRNHVEQDAPALVSCLCVTEDRVPFQPWLLWNFDKQDYPRREMVVIDSSRDLWELPNQPDIRMIRCPHGTGVAEKRNIALAHTKGDLITWFDDDDWQHLSTVNLLTQAFLSGAKVAGCGRFWFVNLATSKARVHTSSSGVLFNSAGFTRELAQSVDFAPKLIKASDTPWLRSVLRRAGRDVALLSEPIFLWLSHDCSISNPSGKGVFREALSEVRTAVGTEAWGGTDDQLSALRSRVFGAAAAVSRPGLQEPRRAVA